MTELIWEGKYDAQGRKAAPPRIALPFQNVETVNESAADRDRMQDLFASGRPTDWRNRLIWGDKKYVLPSLLKEFAGKVNLVYIDPPFDTGANFSYTAIIPDDPDADGDQSATFVKEPSVIEQKAYRDTWGKDLDGYLRWFSDTVILVRDLLADDGSLFVHLDWHVGHYAKTVLDEVYGRDNFLNEIVWYYYNKFQGNVNRFATDHDVIFWYRKSDNYKFQPQHELREKPVRQIKRVWDKRKGSIVNAKDADGKVLYQDATHRTIDDVWRMSMLQPADQTENLRFPTQKPEALLERIVSASSNEGDLVLDCFCGSGTTAAVAEKLGRRWISAISAAFAIHTTRKRLLSIPDVKPFVVQNLGKYERQAWQAAEFGDSAEAAHRRPTASFILELYHAQPARRATSGCTASRAAAWSTSARSTRRSAAATCTRSPPSSARPSAPARTRPSTNGVDVLGWDFAFELNEVAKQEAAAAEHRAAVRPHPARGAGEAGGRAGRHPLLRAGRPRRGRRQEEGRERHPRR